MRTIISPGRCSSFKDKLDDETKLAGLEALVPEELEKHLIRTFGDARLGIVTYGRSLV